MTWFKATSLTIANNSAVATVVSGEDISNIQAGDGLIVGVFTPVEIKRVYIDANNNRFIELVGAWLNATQTSVPSRVLPTSGDFAGAVQALKDATALLSNNFASLDSWYSAMGNVVLTAQNGTEYTARTFKQMDADVQAIQDNNQALIDAASKQAIADMTLPKFDVYIPFNEGLEIERGYGNRDINGNRAVDYSRASSTTSINKSSEYEARLDDEPAITKDGLSVYQVFTNDLVNSHNQSASYVKSKTTVASITDSPVSFDAWQLNETAETGGHYIETPALTVSDVIGISRSFGVHLKVDDALWYGNTSERVGIILYNWSNTNDNGIVSVEFDIDGNPFIGDNTDNIESAAIEKTSSGYYWITGIHTLTSDASLIKLRLNLIRDSSTAYTGDINRYIKTVGWQIAKGAIYKMPYMPTLATPETRANEISTIPMMGNMPAQGEPFTIVIDTTLTNLDNNSGLYSAPEPFYFFLQQKGPGLRLGRTAISWAYQELNYSVGESRIGLVFDNKITKLYQDGVQIGNDIVGEIPYNLLGDLHVGRNARGNTESNSRYKNLGIFHKALSPVQMSALGSAK
jgi:hypothetical protein